MQFSAVTVAGIECLVCYKVCSFAVFQSAMSVSEYRTRKGNGVIHSEARELISKVIQTCDEEAKEKELAFPLSQATKRAPFL
jgi:epoxyqueuosine reductase QueG